MWSRIGVLILAGAVRFLSAQTSSTLALQSAPNPSVFGSPFTLTATVTPTSATGRVTFYDGVAILGESQLSSRQATFTTRLLGGGTHALHAYYAGSQSPITSQTVNSVGAGGFQPAVSYPAGTSPALVIAADFNSDGKTDLAVADYGGTVSLLLGKGDGTFEPPVGTVIAPYCYAIVAGDFNGDGKPDLAVSTPGQVAILLGNGDGTFQNSSILTVGTQPVSLLAIDVNNDGDADLVVLDGDTAIVTVFLGNGDGTFQPPTSFPSPSPKGVVQMLAAGDFNRDGNADLVIVSATDGTVEILSGIGDGSFYRSAELSAPLAATSVAVGDFNGDGKPDIVAGLTPTGVAVFLGNGDGSFQSAAESEGTSLPFPYFGLPLVTGDFNGDGKLDIAAADGGYYAMNASDGVIVALGNGDGTFQQPLLYSTGSGATSALVAGQFNGDGRTDLAATTYAANSVGILLGKSAVNPVVTAVSVTPSSGSGAAAIYSFQFSDTAGGSDIASASGLIGNSVSPAVSAVCAVTYNRPQNTLALWNDNGTVPPGITLGSGSQHNSFCSLNGAGSSVGSSGNTLTLNLALAFNYGDSGSQTWGEAVSATGSTTGWRSLGNWSVSASPTPPQAVTVSPSSGAGINGTFAFAYNDVLGTGDLSSVQAIFQTSPGLPACALTVNPSNGSAWLMNDANTSLLGPLPLGAAGTVQNSQCSVNSAASSGVASANNYILTLAVNFKAAFAGVQKLIGYAASNEGANSGFQTLGTWTVGAAAGPYLISTLAGGQGPAFGSPAASVDIGAPYMIALDGAGNVYFTESTISAAPIDEWRMVRLVGKVDTKGVLTKLADSSSFAYPYGIAADAAGNVYVSDFSIPRVSKISPDGSIYPVVGNGSYGYSGDNGPAINAQLWAPSGLALDRLGNLYIADSGNGCIRKVSPGGIITTIAGTGTQGFSGDGGPAAAAQLNQPRGVAVDTAGNVFVADSYNNRIRKISTAGVITTVAGTGNAGFNGDHIPATTANIWGPWSIAIDSSGNLYFGSDNRVRMVTTDGMISTIAGEGTSGYGGDGGPAISAFLSWPSGVAVDPLGNLYFSDSRRIRAVSKGVITTIAGGGTEDGGPAPFAGTLIAGSLATDGAGNVYVSVPGDNRVRKVTRSGTISTYAGTGVTGNAGDNGPAVSAQLNAPNGIAFDTSGNLFIADTGSNTVRKVSAAGTITTVAGNGSPGYSGDNGPATAAQLYSPMGVAVDASGNLFIADTNNSVVRRVDAAGRITTYAGTGYTSLSGDNGPATQAELNYPQGVAVDGSGNLFINDTANSRIRKVAVDDTISTYVLSDANGIAVDAFGDLYATGGGEVCVLTAVGCTPVLAGGLLSGGYSSYYYEGAPALGVYLLLAGIALDNSGKIYVGNYLWSGAINVLTPEGGLPVFTMTSSQPGTFAPGSTGQYTVTVNNASLAGSTRGTVTVTDVLPPGLTMSSMSGTGWSCSSNSCSRGDVLAGGASYPPIIIIVNVLPTAPAQVTNQVTVSGGGGVMAGLQEFTQLDSLVVNQTDSGPFLQGRTGTYTITVSSSMWSGPNSGTVTLIDTPPPGFTLVSMSGSSWTCPTGGSSCTLTNPMNGYPPVTVTVSVASDAPSPVMNVASVASAGFVGASGADITPVYAQCNVTTDANTSVTDAQRIVNEALGVAAAIDDLNSDGVVNVADVQIVVNAVLRLGCS
jgi:trimeric autotransporter adhesin